jgi:hypothetical protein
LPVVSSDRSIDFDAPVVRLDVEKPGAAINLAECGRVEKPSPKGAPRIPPTQLVDRSYPAYKRTIARDPQSHQRSWWIVHIRPTKGLSRAIRNPTNAENV